MSSIPGENNFIDNDIRLGDPERFRSQLSGELEFKLKQKQQREFSWERKGQEWRSTVGGQEQRQRKKQ